MISFYIRRTLMELNIGIIVGSIFFIGAFIAMKLIPPYGRVKLDFIPVAGERSNYMDCEVEDPNGGIWFSNNSFWSK